MAHKILTNIGIVEHFIANHPDIPALNYVNVRGEDTIYRMREGYYQPLDEKYDLADKLLIYVQEGIEADLIARSKNPTIATVKDMIAILKIKLPRQVEETSGSFVTLSDSSVLDLTSYPFKTVPLTPDIIPVFYLPHPPSILLEDNPRPSLWLKFLSEVLVDPDTKETDQSLVDFIQEMMGYMLIPSAHAQAAFFLIGDGANGKSVLLNVLKAMFPSSSVSSFSIESLTTNRFSLSGLINKRVNIANEEESKYMKSDVFKALITGESMQAERKYGDSFVFTPRIKFLFASNRLPKFDGVEHAIKRRFKLIPFNATFKGDQIDPHLTEKLLKELPTIIAWSLLGAARLIQRNSRFLEPVQLKATQFQFEREQSSVTEFMSENFEITGNVTDMFPTGKLYNIYKIWAEDVGRKGQLSQIAFSRELSKRYGDDGLKFPTHRPVFHGKQQRVVTGLRLISDKTAWIHDTDQLTEINMQSYAEAHPPTDPLPY